jgi:uncharacterized protein (DUF58 family)
MGSHEKYLKPEVIRQVKRLDLRARFIVEGFLSGLHASPFHGFSAEFSEHRRYTPGDDPATLDWNVFARTDRYYVKKFEAETNLTGYLAMDLSASMDYTHQQELSKFEYSICLAAALTYLMIHQSDAVGVVTFDTRLRASLPPRSRRTQLAAILSLLSRARPSERTDVATCLNQLAAMIRHRSLVILLSDLLAEPDPIVRGLHQLKHRGHDVIIFHVLDAAEVEFPFSGMVEFLDKETPQRLVVDADGVRADYLEALAEFRGRYQMECARLGVDYVPLHTGMPFDRALLGYLIDRSKRF